MWICCKWVSGLPPTLHILIGPSCVFLNFRGEICKIGRIAVSTISGEFDDFVTPLPLEVAADMLAGIDMHGPVSIVVQNYRHNESQKAAINAGVCSTPKICNLFS